MMNSKETNRTEPGSLASMGDLLLKGWTMLAESCEDCKVPLMEDPQSGGRFCVNCQLMKHSSPSSSEESDTPIPAGVQTEGALIDLSPRQSLELGSAMVPEVSASKGSQAEKLALRMMKGWTLTANHCPRCNTPLVRSKDQTLFCVTCNLHVFKAGGDPNQSQLALCTRTGQKRSKSSKSMLEKNKVIKSDDHGKTDENTELFDHALECDIRMKSSEPEDSQMRSDQTHSSWKELTTSVLKEKIEEGAHMLQSLPSSNLDSCMQIAKLMDKYIDMIIKLEGIPD